MSSIKSSLLALTGLWSFSLLGSFTWLGLVGDTLSALIFYLISFSLSAIPHFSSYWSTSFKTMKSSFFCEKDVTKWDSIRSVESKSSLFYFTLSTIAAYLMISFTQLKRAVGRLFLKFSGVNQPCSVKDWAFVMVSELRESTSNLRNESANWFVLVESCFHEPACLSFRVSVASSSLPRS